MKTLLVPTDFSVNAEKALEYAIHFALYLNADIVLLHSWDLPHQKSTMFITIQETIRKKAEEDIKELKTKIALRNPEIKVKTHVAMGDAADVIRSAAKKFNADYIIMGTKGASGMKKIVFGSITADVIEDSPCPVFAVPEKAEIRNLKTVGFATEMIHQDKEAICKLTELAKVFNSKIIVTHISTGKIDESTEFNQFTASVKQKCNYENIEAELVPGKDVAESLGNYIKEKQVDILAISKRRRSFFENLFHKSISKEMAYSSEIPLIVFNS